METLVETTRTLESAPHDDLMKQSETLRDDKEQTTGAAEPKRKKYGDIIVIKRSGRDGGRFPILSDTNIVIGRSENCNIRVVIETASEQHVLISVERDKVWLKNLAKLRGSTFVNQCVVMPNEKKALFAGDVVSVCDRNFRIELTPTEKTPAKNIASTIRRSVSSSPTRVLSLTQKGNSKSSSRAGSASPARTTTRSPGRAMAFTATKAMRPLPSKIPTKQRPASMLPSFRIGQLPRPLIDPFASPSLEESLKERRLSSWSRQQVQSTPKDAPSSHLIDLDVPAVTPLGEHRGVRTRHLLDATLTPDPNRNGALHLPMESIDDSLEHRSLAVIDSSKTVSEAVTGREGLSALDESLELVPPTPTCLMPPFQPPVSVNTTTSENNPMEVVEEPASDTPKRPAEMVTEAIPPVAVDDIEQRAADLSQVRRRSSRARPASTSATPKRSAEIVIEAIPPAVDTVEQEHSEQVIGGQRAADLSQVRRRSSRSRPASTSATPKRPAEIVIEAIPPAVDTVEQEHSEQVIGGQRAADLSQVRRRSSRARPASSGGYEEIGMNESGTVEDQSSVFNVTSPLSLFMPRSANSSGLSERVEPSKVLDDTTEEEKETVEEQSSLQEDSLLQPENQLNQSITKLLFDVQSIPCEDDVTKDAEEAINEADRSQVLRRSTRGRPMSSGKRQSTATVDQSANEQVEEQPSLVGANSTRRSSTRKSSSKNRSSVHTPKSQSLNNELIQSTTEQAPDNQLIDLDSQIVSPLLGRSQQFVRTRNLLDATLTPGPSQNVEQRVSMDTFGDSFGGRTPMNYDSTKTVSEDVTGHEGLNALEDTDDHVPPTPTCLLPPFQPIPEVVTAPEESASNVAEEAVSVSPLKFAETAEETSSQVATDNDDSKDSNNEQSNETDRSEVRRRSSRGRSRGERKEVTTNNDLNEYEQKTNVEDQSPKDRRLRRSSAALQSSSSRRSSVQAGKSPSPQKPLQKRVTGSPRDQVRSTPNQPPVDELVDSAAENAEEDVGDTPKRSVEITNEQANGGQEDGHTPVHRRSSRRVVSTGELQLIATDDLNEKEEQKAVEEKESPIAVASATRRSSSARRSSSIAHSVRAEESTDDTTTEADDQELNLVRLVQLAQANTPPCFTPPRSPRVPAKSTLRHPRVAASASESSSDSRRKVEFTPEPVVKLIPRIGTKSVRETERLENEEKKAAAQRASIATSPSTEVAADEMNPNSPPTSEGTPSPRNARSKNSTPSAAADAPSTPTTLVKSGVKRRAPHVDEDVSEKPGDEETASSPRKTPGKRALRSKTTTAAEENQASTNKSAKISAAKKATPKTSAIVKGKAEPAAQKITRKKAATVANADAAPSPAKKDVVARRTKRTKELAEEIEEPVLPPNRGRKTTTAAVEAAPPPPAKPRTKKATAKEDVTEPAASNATKPAEKKSAKTASGKTKQTTKTAASKTDATSSTAKKAATRPAKRAAIEESPASPPKRGRRTIKRADDEAGPSAIADVAPDSPAKPRTKKAAQKTAATVEKKKQSAGKAASAVKKNATTRPAKETKPASPLKRGRRTTKNPDEAGTSAIVERSPAKQRAKKTTPAVGKAKVTSKKSTAAVVEAPPVTEKGAANRPTKRGKEPAAEPEKTMPPPKLTRGRKPAVVEPVEELPVGQRRKVPARTKKN